ncbi:MAG: hypothetical protein LBC89_01450 [Bacteroidales bacterium]|jgi:hypothetical protein|nr:hypothetical protein [Bacteroidales bacterium]
MDKIDKHFNVVRKMTGMTIKSTGDNAMAVRSNDGMGLNSDVKDMV